MKEKIKSFNIESNNEDFNIRTIVDIFINEYTNFKNEYSTINKLNYFRKLRYVNFNTYNDGKHLLLDFDFPNKTKESLLLILKEKNGNYYAQMLNYLMDKDSISWQEKIDKNTIRAYIELFEKYRNLLDAYLSMKKGLTFKTDSNTLNIKINGEILDNLESIEINFETIFMNKPNHLTFKVNLNKQDSLNEQLVINNKNVDPTKFSYFFDNIYLNLEDLPSLFQKPKFNILAVPYPGAYVITNEKAQEFKNQTNTPEDYETIKQMAKTFEENNLSNDQVLKRTRKPN